MVRSLKSFQNIKNRFNKLKNKISFELNHTKLYLTSDIYFPNKRDLAFTTEEKYPQIFVSSKLKNCSWKQIDAILMHELSHAILISKKQKHSERKTDINAEKMFKTKIYYDINDVQTLRKTNKTKRPKYLSNPLKYEK